MATWTDILAGQVDTDSPVTQPLVTALRDNPVAISEGSTDAPVAQAAWHPYDMVNVGDGNDGNIYDFSVDGAVTIISTPTFADGYEYAIRIEALAWTAAGTDFFRWAHDFGAGFATTSETSVTTTTDYWGFAQYALPRPSSRQFFVRGSVANSTETVNVPPIRINTTLPINAARIVLSGSTTAGRVYLLKRREFFSA